MSVCLNNEKEVWHENRLCEVGGAPAQIVQLWQANCGSLGDVDAWMKANADNRAWNACAIVDGTAVARSGRCGKRRQL